MGIEATTSLLAPCCARGGSFWILGGKKIIGRVLKQLLNAVVGSPSLEMSKKCVDVAPEAVVNVVLG